MRPKPSRILTGTAFPIRVWGEAIESGAEQQLRNIARLPHLFRQVAAMPDAHVGIGATVGTVIASETMVIPAAVGVDIGCGVCAAVCPRGVLRLENGLPGDRFDGADSPIAALVESLKTPDVYGYEAWEECGSNRAASGQRT